MIGAALGTTDDPTRLIPGSVEALHTDATEMQARADALEEAAEEVGAQVIAGWLGAAAGGWDERRALLETSLHAVSQALRVAAKAMRDHADVLAWGQAQAMLAIEIWDRALVMAAPVGSALAGAGVPAASFRVRVRPLPAEVDYLTVRNRAEVVLAEARAEVTRSSDALAALLDQLSDGLPDGRWHMDQFAAALWGWVTGAVGLVLFVLPHRRLIDPDGWEADRQAREDQLRATVQYLAANPEQTLDVLLDLQTLEDNPAAWWGGMTPDLVLGAAGVGGGASRLGRWASGRPGLLARKVPVVHASTTGLMGLVDTGNRAAILEAADRAELHVARFTGGPQNDAMVARIREAARTGTPLHYTEVNFLRHELTERDLMDGGMSEEAAHAIAMQTHPTFENYHPDVVREFGQFGLNWRKHWGIEK